MNPDRVFNENWRNNFPLYCARAANLILFARSEVGKYPTKMNTKKSGTGDYQDKLEAIATSIQEQYPASKITHKAVDVQCYEVVESAVSTCAKELCQYPNTS